MPRPCGPCASLQESGLPGYEQLYNDSMRRKMKIEALAAQPPEEATFKPRVCGLGVWMLAYNRAS